MPLAFGTIRTIVCGDHEGERMKIKDDDLARYTITGLLGAVLVFFTIWLVSVEGERTRRTIRESADQRQQRAVNWPVPSVPDPLPTVADGTGGPATELSAVELPKPTVPQSDDQPGEQPEDDFDLDDYVIFPKPDK